MIMQVFFGKGTAASGGFFFSSVAKGMAASSSLPLRGVPAFAILSCLACSCLLANTKGVLTVSHSNANIMKMAEAVGKDYIFFCFSS